MPQPFSGAKSRRREIETAISLYFFRGQLEMLSRDLTCLFCHSLDSLEVIIGEVKAKKAENKVGHAVQTYPSIASYNE